MAFFEQLAQQTMALLERVGEKEINSDRDRDRDRKTDIEIDS